MNKASLTNKLKQISLEKNVNYNTLLLNYFMEELLRKIERSKYKNNFVFKGGFLLSSILGVSNRSTADMDIMLFQQNMNKAELENIFKEITGVCLGDDIAFYLQEVSNIKDDDAYGGFRFHYICMLENIRQHIYVDLATGDKITPDAIMYPYKTMIFDKVLHIKAYNLETIIAEKLHTIYVRNIANGRSKDFYDLYIIYKLKREELDFKLLNQAICNTFDNRDTSFSYDKFVEILLFIKQDSDMQSRWIVYCKKTKYVSTLPFQLIIDSITDLIRVLLYV